MKVSTLTRFVSKMLFKVRRHFRSHDFWRRFKVNNNGLKKFERCQEDVFIEPFKLVAENVDGFFCVSAGVLRRLWPFTISVWPQTSARCIRSIVRRSNLGTCGVSEFRNWIPINSPFFQIKFYFEKQFSAVSSNLSWFLVGTCLWIEFPTSHWLIYWCY